MPSLKLPKLPKLPRPTRWDLFAVGALALGAVLAAANLWIGQSKPAGEPYPSGLTTLFVSSYPYRPQQLVQTISLIVFGTVVASLVWVIGSMNRHTALSRMSGTQPGELTWDRTLYANLALYAIVPLIALVSSQNAALRETLFKWVEPLVNYLVTA